MSYVIIVIRVDRALLKIRELK